MSRNVLIVSLLAAVVLAAGAPARQARAAVKPENVQKMAKAMPDKAPAVPARPRKVLIYSHCNGFVHGPAIAAAKVALPMMGKKTGAYEGVFYCSLGHRDEIFWNPVVLKHYLAGLQWVMGDLAEVNTTPVAQLFRL